MNKGSTYDVVIVGARCAGAALATFLARDGAKVLLLDRDTFPSDQVISTHTIHPPGVDILDELGVGSRLREVTPESPRIRIRKGAAFVDASFADGRHELCPRRFRLDALLQEAATGAGAELWEGSRLRRVLFDESCAVGVEVERDGTADVVHADLTVGADGRHSAVAEQVEAEEYMAYDAPRAMYWGYWIAPAVWPTEAFPFDMYIGHDGSDIRVIFQTDNDQLLIGSLPSVRQAAAWRGDPLGALKQNLAGDPFTRDLVAGHDPVDPVRGTVHERYFFRRGVGPGWALVGDAGHHKEFVVGDGITEALIQAKGLARAILRNDAGALNVWWRARDVEALPAYFWGRDEGGLTPPAQLQVRIFDKVSRDARLKRLMTRLPEHQCSPYDALPISAVLAALLGAVARGRFGVIPEFLAQGRRISEYKKELAKRQRLLEEATVAGSGSATAA